MTFQYPSRPCKRCGGQFVPLGNRALFCDPCKPLASIERVKRWRETNPERFRENQRRWVRENRDKDHENGRRYRETHPERQIVYYKANREKIIKRATQWNKINAAPHRIAWEAHFRIKIPDGFVVHHKDGNHSNNDPHNLLCLPPCEYSRLHRINDHTCDKWEMR